MWIAVTRRNAVEVVMVNVLISTLAGKTQHVYKHGVPTSLHVYKTLITIALVLTNKMYIYDYQKKLDF